jgi:tetratricopeptide (TPR) repeat protein
MRRFFALVLLMFSVVVPSTAQAAALTPAPSRVNEDIRLDISQLKRKAKATTDDVAVLRRDQINYRVEKDLLKEAYSSNLQSINITITIVLAVITILGAILGYFGLKSLNDLKAVYAEELDSLKALKISLESEFGDVREKQKSVETQVDILAKTNQEQDRRLKLLELRDKAVQHFSNNNYYWALEFANAALELKSDDETMLKIRAGSLGKLGNFDGMIEATKKVLELKPDDVQAIGNYAEALAVANRAPEFEAWYEAKKVVIERDKPLGLGVFLKSLLQLMNGDLAKAKTILAPFVDACPPGAAPRLGDWGFDEANIAISRLPENPSKAFARSLIQFLQGGLTKEAMQALLAA